MYTYSYEIGGGSALNIAFDHWVDSSTDRDVLFHTQHNEKEVAHVTQ